MKNKLKGKVISKSGNNIYGVLIERKVRHPLYHKSTVRSKKILAMTKSGQEIGDNIQIEEVRPISKRVNFIISEKVK